ncbi:MAG: NADH-quinone oxidoreductase subunit NuoG [Wenzhouxiangella sp.]|nr:NADH-quinone oxidoreductase subunit NuoG [Wenzhouxiangella sp.]MDR9452837.1 NADH-quinone oxidoreductase subunit NuoG [Wenzhouxiangella sp.]
MATVEQTEVKMVTLEIDGESVSVPAGSMIIEASDQIGIDIPRFCYHRKLSIAANCRMCLVDVEKAPKPLPACATPVADGMKVFTESRRAVDAQRGVMEFLLINHPLDCPICDQGGECELQDLAMGYGRSVSRFTERKRVVKDKNLGSLVATDMTRCIHCTRCVRFLEEIAGTSELGGIGRGEHTEISTFVERNINSELSGNIIDLCPVGALTNKPFRFSARPWEMRAKPSIASHDNVGANLFHHVRGKQIMRCVPKDNERINECWLPDRDRYAHFGLASEQRLAAPKVKVNGQWQDASWDEALSQAEQMIGATVETDPNQLGVLVSPRATTQEHVLLSRLTQALGCDNIDHRLRVGDFSHPLTGAARMDMATAHWPSADAIFLIGSNIRHDQPILGHRVRTAWRQSGAQIMDLNPVAYDFHFDLTARLIDAPQRMVSVLAAVAQHVANDKQVGLPDGFDRLTPSTDHSQDVDRVIATLSQANQGLMVLGDVALNHPQGGALRALAEWLAEALGVSLCILGGPANARGAFTAGVVPNGSGRNAQQMLETPLSTYVLYDFEPSADTANPSDAMRTLESAEHVIALSGFASEDILAVADVILPVASVPQTEGSYTNVDGISQHFEASIPPLGDARPGWKVIKRLGTGLQLPGFDFIDLAAVDTGSDSTSQAAMASDPAVFEAASQCAMSSAELVRIGDVPMYHIDALTRRSKPLQDSDHALPPVVRVHPGTAQALGLVAGQAVRVVQGDAQATLDWAIDERIPEGAVWLPSAQPEVAGLGLAYGPITVEQATT